MRLGLAEPFADRDGIAHQLFGGVGAPGKVEDVGEQLLVGRRGGRAGAFRATVHARPDHGLGPDEHAAVDELADIRLGLGRQRRDMFVRGCGRRACVGFAAEHRGKLVERRSRIGMVASERPRLNRIGLFGGSRRFVDLALPCQKEREEIEFAGGFRAVRRRRFRSRRDLAALGRGALAIGRQRRFGVGAQRLQCGDHLVAFAGHSAAGRDSPVIRADCVGQPIASFEDASQIAPGCHQPVVGRAGRGEQVDRAPRRRFGFDMATALEEDGRQAVEASAGKPVVAEPLARPHRRTDQRFGLFGALGHRQQEGQRFTIARRRCCGHRPCRFMRPQPAAQDRLGFGIFAGLDQRQDRAVARRCRRRGLRPERPGLCHHRDAGQPAKAVDDAKQEIPQLHRRSKAVRWAETARCRIGSSCFSSPSSRTGPAKRLPTVIPWDAVNAVVRLPAPPKPPSRLYPRG